MTSDDPLSVSLLFLAHHLYRYTQESDSMPLPLSVDSYRGFRLPFPSSLVKCVALGVHLLLSPYFQILGLCGFRTPCCLITTQTKCLNVRRSESSNLRDWLATIFMYH